MKYRTYRNTDLTVSEVGFGLWTVSTGWWGSFTEQEAVQLMRKAFDLGVTDYVVKPYREETLLSIIRRVTRERRESPVA